MMVYRIADKRYINDREGVGAKLFGGRWNEVNNACIYTSEHISLSFLEKFIHAKGADSMQNIALLKIEIPDEKDLILKVDSEKLKNDWVEDVSYSQWIGQQILADSSVLAFVVPSAIIQDEHNIIINPLSIHFNQLIFHPIVEFKTELRLLKLLSL